MKVDYVFMPNVNEIYRFKPLNKIFLHSFSKNYAVNLDQDILEVL